MLLDALFVYVEPFQVDVRADRIDLKAKWYLQVAPRIEFAYVEGDDPGSEQSDDLVASIFNAYANFTRNVELPSRAANGQSLSLNETEQLEPKTDFDRAGEDTVDEMAIKLCVSRQPFTTPSKPYGQLAIARL